MTGNSTPAINPNDEDSLSGAFRHIMKKFLQGEIDDMLPCEVLSFDRTKSPPRVQVKPLIMMVATDGTKLTRAPVASVPVAQWGGGGFMASFPIKKGDLGFIKASDRDISLFLNSFKEVSPQTKRMHSFSDGFFMPLALTGYVLASEDSNNFVLQSLDGTQKIAFWQNFIKIIANGVGIGGSPRAGALLDLQSTTKAFQLMGMTLEQRDAIPSPRGGMVVYISDPHPGHAVEKFSFYTNGTGWS